MESTAELLHREQHLRSLEDRIAPLAEVFRLQGADELQEAERRYLPNPTRRMAAVILAASRGPELGPLTEKIPKAMVTIAGKPLLAHIAEAYHRAGIRDLTVVRGYKMESVNVPQIRYAENHAFETTGELVSLAKGLDHVTDQQSVIISYGDVLFRKYIPEALAEQDEPLVIAVDTGWRESANRHRQADYVRCTSPSKGRQNYFSRVELVEMSENISVDQIDGEWMGFLKVSAAGLPQVRSILSELLAEPANGTAKMPLLINALLRRGHGIRVLYMTGHWLDVDSLEDVIAAAEVFR